MAKVLLIDDNEDIHRFVRYHVEKAGHSVLGARERRQTH
jgi:DNA-binding response OmpR family regulator